MTSEITLSFYYEINIRYSDQWIQVDLLMDKTIHSIATQGMLRGTNTNRWVEMYHVAYQVEGSSSEDFIYVTDETSGHRIVSCYKTACCY